MKTLIAYYSRTKITEEVAEAIQKELNCDIEEISTSENYNGALGYIKGGKHATEKSSPEIKFTKNPKDYDLVIIGTPVWAWTMAPPIRTYLSKNKFKNVAFFCTMGKSGDKKTYLHMKELSKKPKASLSLLTKEIKDNNYKEKISNFIKEL
jgi:flavodoxin